MGALDWANGTGVRGILGEKVCGGGDEGGGVDMGYGGEKVGNMHTNGGLHD